MTGEERRKQLKEQMKEAYKKDILKRREILEQAKRLRSSSKLNSAIQNITSALHDDSDDWIEKLNQESALTEAKMDLALDEALASNQKLNDLAKKAEAEKFSSTQLIDEMKKEMGLLVDDEEVDPLEQELLDEIKEEESKPKKSLGDI
ncbi:MAG: hypothetical protein AAF804_17730 [Bacteroidota bacterium]